MENDISERTEFTAVKLDDLPKIAQAIYDYGKNHKIWLFNAEMGGGKTTLITQICDFLNVEDHVSSPTFALVNEYYSPKIKEVYHFDFYRIKNEQEAFEIGVEDYFYSGQLCLIEWPEMIPSFIPDKFLMIELSLRENPDERNIKLSKHG